MLTGNMMATPLTITSIMKHAEKVFSDVEVVSVVSDNPRHRYIYKEAFSRARQLANALTELGVEPGDRVATLAWNDYRHLEIYYAVPCYGAVCHTINPRLFAEQIEYIVNHSDDQVLFIDPLFVPLIEQLAGKINSVKTIGVLTSEDNMPNSDILELCCYETLIAHQSTEFDWPALDENTASSLCYTSGTTGNPKGVLYSHRSTVLHSYAAALPTGFCLSPTEVMLPVVPMFHVNAWSIPYVAPMMGTKLVFPGPKMADGKELTSLMNEEGVTISAGVPTVWLALLNYLKQSGTQLSSLNRVIVGGAACPLAMLKEFEEHHKVTVMHAWGMTEMSPLGTVNVLKPGIKQLPKDQQYQCQLKQGLPVYGVDMRIVNDDGVEQPWDGKTVGKLQVKGPWVCASYFNVDESDAHQEGWLDTGDISTIDEHGYMQITDRSKDVIKSGGEWISSIELENAALGYQGVKEAAVIAMPDEKWDERPLMLIVVDEGASLDKQDLNDYLATKVAKWWLPDRIEVVESLAHTATGKLDKKTMRKQYCI